MEFVVLGLAASLAFIVFLLRKIAIQNQKIEDLYNRAMYEKYTADLIAREYDKMLEEYVVFREEMKQTMDN
jgi:hypothetical protein